MSGKVNVTLSFPIIIMIGNDFEVCQSIKDYTKCVGSYIPTLNKTKESVIDSNGYLYKRGNVTPIKYINPFYGFSLKSAGFGVYYVEKELFLEKELSLDELKDLGRKVLKKRITYFKNTDLDIETWTLRFENLTNKELVVRYLLFFAEPALSSLRYSS